MMKSSGHFGSEAQMESSARVAQAAEELRAMHAQKDGIGLMRRQLDDADDGDRGVTYIGAARTDRAAEDGEAWGASDEEADSDAEFLDDPELDSLRQARIAQLKKEQDRKMQGYGELREIVEEEFLPEVTSRELVAVHFYHRDFERCKIMDMHLGRVARHQLGTKFLRINAEKAPFFVEKLAIRTLPTVVLFKNGVAEDRLVGFNEVGGDDSFKTRRLEDYLVATGFAEETDDGTYGADDDEVEGLKAAMAAEQGVKSSVLSLRRDIGDGM